MPNIPTQKENAVYVIYMLTVEICELKSFQAALVTSSQMSML
jgi:hypothetical protein